MCSHIHIHPRTWIPTWPALSQTAPTSNCAYLPGSALRARIEDEKRIQKKRITQQYTRPRTSQTLLLPSHQASPPTPTLPYLLHSPASYLPMPTAQPLRTLHAFPVRVLCAPPQAHAPIPSCQVHTCSLCDCKTAAARQLTRGEPSTGLVRTGSHLNPCTAAVRPCAVET